MKKEGRKVVVYVHKRLSKVTSRLAKNTRCHIVSNKWPDQNKAKRYQNIILAKFLQNCSAQTNVGKHYFKCIIDGLHSTSRAFLKLFGFFRLLLQYWSLPYLWKAVVLTLDGLFMHHSQQSMRHPQ